MSKFSLGTVFDEFRRLLVCAWLYIILLLCCYFAQKN